MKDQFDNEMETFVASAKVEDMSGTVRITLTLVLRSKIEMRKLDIVKDVFPGSPESVDRLIEEKIESHEFGAKTEAVRKAVRGLVRKEPGAGKFFLREAMEAYSVKEKLNHSQIEEVMMGVFLVGGVSKL